MNEQFNNSGSPFFFPFMRNSSNSFIVSLDQYDKKFKKKYIESITDQPKLAAVANLYHKAILSLESEISEQILYTRQIIRRISGNAVHCNSFYAYDKHHFIRTRESGKKHGGSWVAAAILSNLHSIFGPSQLLQQLGNVVVTGCVEIKYDENHKEIHCVTAGNLFEKFKAFVSDPDKRVFIFPKSDPAGTMDINDFIEDSDKEIVRCESVNELRQLIESEEVDNDTRFVLPLERIEFFSELSSLFEITPRFTNQESHRSEEPPLQKNTYTEEQEDSQETDTENNSTFKNKLVSFLLKNVAIVPIVLFVLLLLLSSLVGLIFDHIFSPTHYIEITFPPNNANNEPWDDSPIKTATAPDPIIVVDRSLFKSDQCSDSFTCVIPFFTQTKKNKFAISIYESDSPGLFGDKEYIDDSETVQNEKVISGNYAVGEYVVNNIKFRIAEGTITERKKVSYNMDKVDHEIETKKTNSVIIESDDPFFRNLLTESHYNLIRKNFHNPTTTIFFLCVCTILLLLLFILISVIIHLNRLDDRLSKAISSKQKKFPDFFWDQDKVILRYNLTQFAFKYLKKKNTNMRRKRFMELISQEFGEEPIFYFEPLVAFRNRLCILRSSDSLESDKAPIWVTYSKRSIVSMGLDNCHGNWVHFLVPQVFILFSIFEWDKLEYINHVYSGGIPLWFLALTPFILFFLLYSALLSHTEFTASLSNGDHIAVHLPGATREYRSKLQTALNRFHNMSESTSK